MAAAAVLSPSSSGLSTPASEQQYTTTTGTMEKKITPIQAHTYLAQKMASVLHALNYETSSINTLITRAESNTIEASNISAENLLGNSESISDFLSSTVLNEKTLRERSIYLNSNEPVLLLGYASDLGLGVPQIRDVKENVLNVLRERGIKPARVYIRETVSDDTDEESVGGLSFSLLNVVNSDIGVNMVSLLDSAFYGSEWKDELVLKEGYNGYDLIWRDEAWTDEKSNETIEESVVEEAAEEAQAGAAEDVGRENADAIAAAVVGATAALPAAAAAAGTTTDAPIAPATAEVQVVKQEPIESGSAGAELKRMPDAPVRSVSYKSADDVPDSDDDEEPQSVQHPALKELIERESQKPPVQHPTWSRDHDGEAYLDIIKTHSRGQEDPESLSVIAHPEVEKDDFEVVDKP